MYTMKLTEGAHWRHS